MKLFAASLALTLRYAPIAAQTCNGVSGPFTLSDITGACDYDTLLEEYTRQVFDVAGATCSTGSTRTAAEDLDAKLIAAVSGATIAKDAATTICRAMYDNADVTPFTKAANKGTDLHFEQMFYNGLSDWQEEVETIYESDDQSATSVLREDAAKVKEFYQGEGSYSRVSWPNALTNFDESTCTANAAMCCWPKDRQANDGNGNCATPYDENCVDKDPADNTNLCFADLKKGNLSSKFDSDSGFMVFPEDNNNGEGSIHCHGLAWSNDEYDPISRYKANNLFFVSMYDHMHQRGYVKNIPGMPMCACMEQMPMATRSDCTEVDLTEDWKVEFDGTSFTGILEKVEVDFNACQGRNNRNNDLWAYAARLYDEGRMTRHQFGTVGRTLTNDHDCYHAVENAKAQKGFVTGYNHDESMWTKVAGRDDMKEGEPFGREAFNTAFFEQSLTKPDDLNVAAFPTDSDKTPIIMRICPDCTSTHRRIFYRRLTPVADPKFDLLHNILFYRPHRSDRQHTGNIWGTDFSLHSSYADAVSGANPWQCRNNVFDSRAPFTGDCSPSGARVHNQYTVFNWSPGPRPNVAYYVNKPEATGVQDYSDNAGKTRAVGFTDVDIGDVRLEGNTLEDDGTLHITGAGSDIWNYSDEFHYHSQPASGDIDVKVHITDFANNGGRQYAKAGIMLRSDNSPDATYAFAQLTGKEGIHAQNRRSKGGAAGNSGSGFKTTPYQTSTWLRIVKKMETIEFYRSDTGLDGDWILHATDSIFFPDDTYRVGLAVCSNRVDYLAEATFEDYTVAAYSFPTSAPSVSAAPTPWQPLLDIGKPQRAGEYYVSNEIDVVKGSGDGLWGRSDSFAFYNNQVDTSDTTTVEMYIKRFHAGNVFARGGIMIRESNDADSANVFVGAAGGRQGVVFQSRSATGAMTDHHKMIYTTYNNDFYVKLTKTGDNVTAYYKVLADDLWIELGTKTLAATKVQVGRAVTAGTDYQYALETMETTQYNVF